MVLILFFLGGKVGEGTSHVPFLCVRFHVPPYTIYTGHEFQKFNDNEI